MRRLLVLAARVVVPASTATIFLAVLLGAAHAPALAFTIPTSSDPADGWRAIAPVGNLEGQPIASVGLAWEADHVGWNTSLGFDDSDAAGWHPPVPRTIHSVTNSIWADDPSISGDTPAYFRLAFTLESDPLVAWFGSSGTNYANVIDDDAQIYVNGTLVYDDQDGEATFIPIVNVTSYLHAGENLLAIKAHDTVGLFEHVSMVLQIDRPIPEPATALLRGLGLCAVAAARKPRT
jgi:hypothetical protein